MPILKSLKRTSTTRRRVSRESSGSTVERIVESLRISIKEGHYVPGQRLIEADITRTMNVSRGPLREALRRLAGEGLMDIEHHRGARVKQLTRAEVASQYEVREVIEGLAARLAATRIGEGHNRANLNGLLRSMNEAAASHDTRKYSALNEQLHAMIVGMSGNPHLPQLARQLSAPIFRLQFRAFLDPEQIKHSHRDHGLIIEAILDGNATGAERAIRSHIRRAAHAMNGLPSSWWPSELHD